MPQRNLWHQWVISLRTSLLFSVIIVGLGTYYAFLQKANTAQHTGYITTKQSYAGQPDTFTLIAQDADLVVEGVVKAVLPARWATPNAKVPENIQPHNPAEHIRTPVEFSVERVFKGKHELGTLIFSFMGGQAGTSMMASEEAEVYKPGTRMIVFLYKGQPGSPPAHIHAGAWFPSMPLIIQDHVAHGPIRDIPLAEVIQQIQAGR